MIEKYYTSDKQHPEDAIFKTKTFINELQKVQESYFAKLAKDLNLSKEGEDWLFDYVFNSDHQDEDFESFLEFFNIKYKNIIESNLYAYMHKPTKTWVYFLPERNVIGLCLREDASTYRNQNELTDKLLKCSFNGDENYCKNNLLEFEIINLNKS